MTVVTEDPKKFPLGKFIGCGCTVLFLAVIAIVAAVVMGVFGLLKNSQPFSDSIAAANANSAAVEALGKPIEAGFLVSGNISFENDSGTADLNIPVSGPNGKGKIHLEGTKDVSGWTYQVWELRVDGNTEPIPLGN